MPYRDPKDRQDRLADKRQDPEWVATEKKRKREWYVANRERVLADQKARYDSATPEEKRRRTGVDLEKKKAYNKAYYQRTREKQVARSKAWRDALSPEEKLALGRRNKKRDQERLERKREAHAGRKRPTLCECGCGRSGGGRSKKHKTVWDHDHATGEFRGYPCARCNSIMGLANDSTEILQGIIDYLKRGGGPPNIRGEVDILEEVGELIFPTNSARG